MRTSSPAASFRGATSRGSAAFRASSSQTALSAASVALRPSSSLVLGGGRSLRYGRSMSANRSVSPGQYIRRQMSHHTNHAPSHQWQPILNQRWPQRDDKGPHARDIPTGTENTPVQARIHWRTDGWETVTGRVTRRANGCVYVELTDPRMMTSGVWVSVEHVRSMREG